MSKVILILEGFGEAFYIYLHYNCGSDKITLLSQIPAQYTPRTEALDYNVFDPCFKEGITKQTLISFCIKKAVNIHNSHINIPIYKNTIAVGDSPTFSYCTARNYSPEWCKIRMLSTGGHTNHLHCPLKN